MVRSIAALALVPLLCGAAPQQKLQPTYKQAMRCAGLIGAQLAIIPQEDPNRGAINAAGNDWIVVIVAEMNDKAMDKDAVFAEARAARAKAGEELTAGGAAAKTELAACVRDAPKLDS